MGVADAATERRVALLAAGGTGGHVWPAVAVARALQAMDSAWECRFIAGDRPIEREVYGAAEIVPTVFPVPPPSRGRWRTWLAMGPTFLRARRLIRGLRPRVILATGGYVSAPVALAGSMRGIPTVLLEPNSVPGRVTRKLASRVAAVAVADEAAGPRLRARRVEVTGNPQIWSAEDLDRVAARRRWGIPDDALCLLVAGGSQGARRLNQLMVEVAAAWAERPPPRPVHLLWMTGTPNLEEVRGLLGEPPDPPPSLTIHLEGHLAPFTDALAAADLAVSRAGAGSVSDLALAGLPSVLLPLPIALDDHQRANAKRLVGPGAAVVFDERTGSAEDLRTQLDTLLGAPDRLAAMATAARSAAQPEAAQRVAELLVSLSLAS